MAVGLVRVACPSSSTPGDLSQGSFWLTKKNSVQSGGYNGAVDEIKFYNYPLSQAEIREKMHLIQKYPVESGLVKYFQFNQYDFATPYVPDLMSDYEVGVKSQCIIASTAPVATGTVFRNPDVSTAGVYDFPGIV